MTLVIGLLGPAGAGKSTVAKYLLEKCYNAKVYSLAAPLKEIAKRVMLFTDEQLYGSQAQKEAPDIRYGFSARTFLQRLGTDGIRNVLGLDIWIEACLRKIKVEGPDVAIVEDLRFINEASAFRNADKKYPGLFGYVWRLVPPPGDETTDYAIAAGLHPSEREWFDAPYDSSLEPDGRGVAKLQQLVDVVLEQYPIPQPRPNGQIGY